MISMRPLVGVLVCVSLLSAAPARADVITDWNVITTNTIGAVTPNRLIEITMVHLAMHDAIQSIQHRFETYSSGLAPGSGSEIAAAATAARDVLIKLFPGSSAAVESTYLTYLQDNRLTTSDPGVAAGQRAAAAIIQNRAGDGSYPVPSPTFFGGTRPGEWRPTVLSPTGEPTSMTTPWLATMRTFAVTHSSQMFSSAPPRLTSRRYTRDYNEVKALGRNVGSSRTPEQTAIAAFYIENAVVYWNRTLRSLTDRYIKDVGESARLFALVNVGDDRRSPDLVAVEDSIQLLAADHRHSTGRQRRQSLHGRRPHLAAAVPDAQLLRLQLGCKRSGRRRRGNAEAVLPYLIV